MACQNFFESNMEESPAAQLIAVCIQQPEFNVLLNDIRDFDWKVINKLRASDLDRLTSTGFRFATKGVENRRQELKAFLIANPACMASDFEIIVAKFRMYGILITPKRTPIAAQPKKKKAPIVIEETDSESSGSEIVGLSSSSEEEEAVKKPKKAKPKKAKPKKVEPEEEEEEEEEEEDTGRRIWY